MDKNLETIQTIEINNELKYFNSLDSGKKINRVYSSFSNYHVAQSKLSMAKNPLQIERIKFDMDKAFIIAEKEFQMLTSKEKVSFMDFVLDKIQTCVNSQRDVVKLTGVLLFGTIIGRLETLQDEEILSKLDKLKSEYVKLENEYLGIYNEERDFGAN